MTEPRAEYGTRLKRWRERIADLDRRHLLLSNARLIAAAVIAIVLWLAFGRAVVSPWWIVVAALGFGALAVLHARVLQRIERGNRAAALYERALERLNGRWQGTGRSGDRFLGGHPYARDLDIYGHASLFELLNTARTEAGEETLAGWLGKGAAIDEVLARQAAVDELRRKLDFREDLAVLAAEGDVSRTGTLAQWSASSPVGFSATVRAILAVCAAITVALALLAYYDIVPPMLAIAWLFAEYGIVRIWRRRLQLVIERVGQPVDDLALVAELLSRIEREPAVAPRLTALNAALSTGGLVASRAIAKLTQLVSLRESSTHNLLFAPFTAALLVPDQLIIAIDRWHAAHGHAVEGWLRAVGELEALSALATYAYEHPADPFPVLAPQGPVFDADALGHPLIREDVAVRNDVKLGDGGPRVIVLSGSNMSGKSTMLRAVGVNVVLALAGAPVRATRLRVSPLVVGATLRITDSLEEGQSRFYAEILRIRGIVDASRGPVPLLFLLDEILHGTNSHDRRIGAEAIVRALVDAGAIGFITTHDLALTELPSRLGPAGVNMHFEDRIENGRIVFDYRIRPGVVEHSNALALMRAVGLDV
jgi:DNA mismatch repair ATPase MutS